MKMRFHTYMYIFYDSHMFQSFSRMTNRIRYKCQMNEWNGQKKTHTEMSNS